MTTDAATLPGVVPLVLARPPPRGYWQRVRRRMMRDPVGMVCLVVLLAIALSAMFAPWLAPSDPYKGSMTRRLLAPGQRGFLLGTDELGRDMVSRLLYGGRVSLMMGIAPVIVATAIGGALGIVAGFYGRHVNMVIMRVVDVFYAFPSVLLAVAMAGVLGSGIFNSFVSLTLVFIPSVRGETISLPLKEFELLELLLRNAGRVLTRGQLIDRVWGADYVGDTKTLDVHVKRLRAKLELEPGIPHHLVTVRGLGYKFES